MPGFIPFRCPRCGFNLHRLKARVEEAQSEYPKAFTPWTREDDDVLKSMVAAGASPDEIGSKLGRQDTAIIKRIEKRQLKHESKHSGRTANTAVTGEWCHGPTDQLWRAKKLAEGLDPQSDMLQSHLFQAERSPKGEVFTRCAVCTYDQKFKKRKSV